MCEYTCGGNVLPERPDQCTGEPPDDFVCVSESHRSKSHEIRYKLPSDIVVLAEFIELEQVTTDVLLLFIMNR